MGKEVNYEICPNFEKDCKRLTVNTQSLGGKQRNLHRGTLNLTLIDGIVVGGIDQYGEFRSDFVVHHLDGCIQFLVVFEPG